MDFENIFVKHNNNLINQFLRYSVVGGIASVIDISLFSFMANSLDFNHLIANTISFIFGLLSNYLLCTLWVFKKKNSFAADFALFSIIGIIGLILSDFILFLLIDLGIIHRLILFLNTDQLKIVAKGIAVFIVLFWNFIARKKLVFNK